MTINRLRGPAIAAGSIVLLGTLVAAASARRAQPNTWKRERGVVLDLRYTDPDVVKTADGRLRAYFNGEGGIRSATSSDGRKWDIEPGARMQGAHPALVKLPDGRLRLYYQQNSTEQARPYLSAVSTDGLNFVAEDGVRLRPGPGPSDRYGIVHPHVIRLANGSYRMYYDGENSPPRMNGVAWENILSASSPDGLTWSKDRGARFKADARSTSFAHLVWSPFVERVGKKKYKMYFNAESDKQSRSGIYSATSRNGLSFKLRMKPELGVNRSAPKGPAIGGPPGLPQDPFVIKLGSLERMLVWEAGIGTITAKRRQR